MSSYIYFFLKGDNRFYPLGTSSRSSKIYQYGSRYAPCGKVVPITQETINMIKENIKEDLREVNTHKAKFKELKSAIMQSNSPLEEKITSYNEYTAYEEEDTQEESDLIQAIGFFAFLNNLIEEAKDLKYWEEEDDKKSVPIVDCNNYIYVGCDTAYPNLDNITSKEE